MGKIGANRLPNFIVVGPPRTATTWLDRALRGHVGLPAQTKETMFFARNYERGITWYAKHFSQFENTQVVGEICAAYFENPIACERIHTDIPECKIICTLRNPVDRLYSYYKLMRRNGRTALPFEEAVIRHQKMLTFSRYAALLQNWHVRFGKGNVLVALNDDLAANPQSYIDQITDFIGIDKILLPDQTIVRSRQNTIETAPWSPLLARNARRIRSWLGSHQFYRSRKFLDRAGVWRFCFEGGEQFPPLDPALRLRLQEILRPEIEQLEQLLCRDLSNWRDVEKRDSGALSGAPYPEPRTRSAFAPNS